MITTNRNVELTRQGWKTTSLVESFNPKDYLSEVDERLRRRQAPGRSFAIWQHREPKDPKLMEVKKVVIRVFEEATEKKLNGIQRFVIDGRLADYMSETRFHGNGELISEISLKLFGDAEYLKREGFYTRQLYSEFREREVRHVTLRDLIESVYSDYCDFESSQLRSA